MTVNQIVYFNKQNGFLILILRNFYELNKIVTYLRNYLFFFKNNSAIILIAKYKRVRSNCKFTQKLAIKGVGLDCKFAQKLTFRCC